MAQGNTVDFEDLSLSIDTFWNGNSQAGQFNSNQVTFYNNYDTSFGGFWSGVAYSTMRDSTTAGFGNQYSCISAEGYNSSQTYAVFTPNSDTIIEIPNWSSLSGFWINNSTYAYLSMKNGDMFAKKFGDSTNASGAFDGTNGNDFFKLTIFGQYNDSVEFYLADFRGPDALDYIIKDWTFVDLSALDVRTKALTFAMTSSDVGGFGMNTPKYFCMDNLIYNAFVSVSELVESDIQLFPNPTQNVVNVKLPTQFTEGTLRLIDVTGREIMNTNISGTNRFELDLSKEKNGVYFAVISINDQVITKRIIKQ